MKKLIYVENTRKNEILNWAVEQQALCVLTSHTTTGWRTEKAKFIEGAGDNGKLVLAFAKGNGETAADYTPGERVGLSFRRGHKKCMCASVVLGVAQGAEGSAEADRVILRWPDAMQELQRRVYYRATPSRRVHVRYWNGGVARRADAESADSGIGFGTLLDLSAGGMRIRVQDRPGEFVEGDAFGCAFAPKPRAETVVLDGVFRHLQHEEDGSWSIGLQFVGLETSERGRQTLADLANIVTEYHRQAQRSQRRPVSGSAGRS